MAWAMCRADVEEWPAPPTTREHLGLAGNVGVLGRLGKAIGAIWGLREETSVFIWWLFNISLLWSKLCKNNQNQNKYSSIVLQNPDMSLFGSDKKCGTLRGNNPQTQTLI